MWYTWALVLVLVALVKSDEVVKSEEVAQTETPIPTATTRAPPRTLDRHAAELAWRSWLQSPESGNQNAPPRRITTKSLFITPLNCPKGQRLDRNGCVQVVTVNKDEHERILLEQLNAIFTVAPGGIEYDYGDETGPLQVIIPIAIDPQAAPLQAPEPSIQAQQLLENNVKKDERKPNIDASLEAELELLKLQNSQNRVNQTSSNGIDNNLPLLDKPKRDTPIMNDTDAVSLNTTNDEGQKELIYGNVNIDPEILNTEYQNQNTNNGMQAAGESSEMSILNNNTYHTNNSTNTANNSKSDALQINDQNSKLNPENEYSNIGEAIKLISRYADVTTDDNFSKDQNKHKQLENEGSFLGTRTRLQNRRKQQKTTQKKQEPLPISIDSSQKDPPHSRDKIYFRYPWSNQNSPTPPPNYPFHHLQDYWPGRKQAGGVYNLGHENPTRHHHSYIRSYSRPGSYSNSFDGYAGPHHRPEPYPSQLQEYAQRTNPHDSSLRSGADNQQDLYSLLGLRHWFSNEGTSNR